MSSDWRRLFTVRLAFAAILSLAACSSGPAAEDTGGECTYASCEAECAARGSHYASCGGGTCHCADEVDVVDAEDAGAADDGRDREDADDSEASPSCDGYIVPNEERLGGAPDVLCRRISPPGLEESLLDFHADGPFVVFRATPDTVPLRLWAADRRTRCIELLDGLEDTTYHVMVGAAYPSVEGDFVAYVVASRDGLLEEAELQIRLGTISTRERRVLVDRRETPWDYSHGPIVDGVVLHFPWVLWRDVREENLFSWYAYGLNIETGEVRNLSVAPAGAPADARGMWNGVVNIGVLGDVVVFGTSYTVGTSPPVEEIIQLNLTTGEGGPITSDPADQWRPVITSGWIAWLDQRGMPTCNSQSPCRTDIYGLDRETGEERALVVAGNSMQGPSMDGEGDWLVYDDQRDGRDYEDVSECCRPSQDIYALHLPTMTEIRVTDWPGFEMGPKVYDRGDGTWGALFVEEIDYGGAIYRLWDCDLPEP